MTFTDDLDAVRVRAGIRHPARFRIKRFPLGSSTDPVWPWRVTDAERPHVFGRARTHAAAVLLIDAIVSGTTTVLDGDDEVIAYRPGPADEAFRPTMLDGYLEQLRGYSRAIAREYDTALGAALLPDCGCGSVDKYGDDIGEHSPRCPYHLAVLRLAPLVDRQTLDRVCKASLERMARRA